MAIGVTVIFGTVRTSSAPSEASGMSGPPGGAWTQPCSVRRPRREPKKRPLKAEPPPKPVSEETFKGRDFERRVRTFVHP